jgi:hypothetical protein
VRDLIDAFTQFGRSRIPGLGDAQQVRQHAARLRQSARPAQRIDAAITQLAHAQAPHRRHAHARVGHGRHLRPDALGSVEPMRGRIEVVFPGSLFRAPDQCAFHSREPLVRTCIARAPAQGFMEVIERATPFFAETASLQFPLAAVVDLDDFVQAVHARQERADTRVLGRGGARHRCHFMHTPQRSGVVVEGRDRGIAFGNQRGDRAIEGSGDTCIVRSRPAQREQKRQGIPVFAEQATGLQPALRFGQRRINRIRVDLHQRRLPRRYDDRVLAADGHARVASRVGRSLATAIASLAATGEQGQRARHGARTHHARPPRPHEPQSVKAAPCTG